MLLMKKKKALGLSGLGHVRPYAKIEATIVPRIGIKQPCLIHQPPNNHPRQNEYSTCHTMLEYWC